MKLVASIFNKVVKLLYGLLKNIIIIESTGFPLITVHYDNKKHVKVTILFDDKSQIIVEYSVERSTTQRSLRRR